jgi:hypothetical protein
MCKRELETGEQIYLVQGEKFVCEADYIKSVQAVQQNTAFAMPQVSTVVNPQSSDNQSVTTEASVEMPPVGVGKGRKGSRTMLTSSQLQKLNQVYEYEPRPTKETKSALAKATGLDVKVIQNWFQNQRSKKRREEQTLVTSIGTGADEPQEM